jgi:aryl sulfotransferase
MQKANKPEIRHSYEHHHLAASRWQAIKTRPGDIVISTSYKAGTTWMQGIVGNLIFHETGMPASRGELSPWPDMRLVPEEMVLKVLEEQTHRRFIKTHLPLDGMPFYDHVKYVVVARDPRDVFMSLLNHWGNYTDEVLDNLNNNPTRVGAPFPRMPDDLHAVWKDWIGKGWFEWEDDGYPYWSHLHHCKTWWEFKDLPNIELFHYSDMLDNLEREMRRVATFLDIDIPESSWPGLVEKCTFTSMRETAIAEEDPERPSIFKGGARTFFNKGTNGRWKGFLTNQELEMYRSAMQRTLPADGRAWLEGGWQGL